MRPAIFTFTAVALVAAAPSRAQTPPSPPPAAVEAPDSPESMENVQPGDHWTYEIRDEITGDIKATTTNIVTDVGPSEVGTRIGWLGNPNSGYQTFDRSWNVINNGAWRYTPNDGGGVRLPLAVGKTWTFKATDLQSTGGFSWKRSGATKVVAQESITTRAGTFDTFKMETSIQAQAANDPTKKVQVAVQTWYAPQINHWVKRATVARSDGRVRENTVQELVEYGRR